MSWSPGLRYMVGAAFCFSLMSVFVKLAGVRLPTAEIVFVRSAMSLVMTWAMLKQAGISPWGHSRRLLLLRGVFGFAGLLCFFFAISRLPLGDVTVLHYTNPVLTAMFAGLFLGEHTGRRELLGLAACAAGVILVARPSFLFGVGPPLDFPAVAAALGGAVCSAAAYTTVRKLRSTEHHLVVVLYFPLVATPLSIPLMIGHAVWPTAVEWLWLLGVGISTQIAQVLLTRGLHAERAGRAMSMSYVQIVFAVLWGWSLFSEPPDAWTLLGAAAVIAGTALTARGATRPSGR